MTLESTSSSYKLRVVEKGQCCAFNFYWNGILNVHFCGLKVSFKEIIVHAIGTDDLTKKGIRKNKILVRHSFWVYFQVDILLTYDFSSGTQGVHVLIFCCMYWKSWSITKKCQEVDDKGNKDSSFVNFRDIIITVFAKRFHVQTVVVWTEYLLYNCPFHVVFSFVFLLLRMVCKMSEYNVYVI